MRVFSFICFVKMVYRTLRHAYWMGPGDDWISGCDYIEQDDGTLKCRICRHISK